MWVDLIMIVMGYVLTIRGDELRMLRITTYVIMDLLCFSQKVFSKPSLTKSV